MDMIESAVARKRNRFIGIFWGLAGMVLLTTGGYYCKLPTSILIAVGYFAVWGILAWLGGRRRLRIPCPACGKKSESDEAIAFRRCTYCGGELFAAPTEEPAIPGLTALPTQPFRRWTLPILVFGSGAIFYGLAAWLLPDDHSGLTAVTSASRAVFTAGALPFAAAVWLLLERRREQNEPVCPICGVHFSSSWANVSGNCNRCGAALLEVFDAEPGIPLPSPEMISRYMQTSERRAAIISSIAIILSMLTAFISCGFALMMTLLPVFLIIVAAVHRISDRRLRKQLRLGNCPGCGATEVPWVVHPRRCPECGRRVIK